MGLLSSMIEGFTNGYAQARGSRGSSGEEPGRIDRLCRELGWSIDEREGETVKLFFKDPLVGRRIVMIHSGDDVLVLFVVYSHAFVPAEKVPNSVAWHLLGRNNVVAMGKWSADEAKDGDAVFALTYTALGEGLTAAALKYICQKMLGEAGEFDQKMQAAGMLR